MIFKYKWVQLSIMLLAILCSVWQGANYYIEVFSERYHDSLERKAKQLEEQYLFIDENLDSLLLKNWSDVQSDLEDTDNDHEHDQEYEYDTSDEYTDGYDQSKSEIIEK